MIKAFEKVLAENECHGEITHWACDGRGCPACGYAGTILDWRPKEEKKPK
jgi:hypothetical protein